MSTLDTTFRNYTQQQAALYATSRGAYPAALYNHIIDYHNTTGNGCFGTLLDIGCGTGGATRDLASHFENVTGSDHGAEMIEQAAKIGGVTKSGKLIRYEVAGAEQLQSLENVQPGSVDMICSAMAAHWFEMGTFWPAVARMLKPGGTVALWTMSSLYCHPSTPNATAVQQILSHLEDVVLAPHELHSNHLSRTMYDTLSMPWDVDSSSSDFPRDSFVRREWNRGGRLEAGQTDFFGSSKEVTLKELGNSLSTASMVTRWRESHPELVKTDQDCVELTIRAIVQAMHSEDKHLDQVKIRVASSTTLLLFAKGKAST